MPALSAIKSRIQSLIDEGLSLAQIKPPYDNPDGLHSDRCSGGLTAARHAIEIASPFGSAYRADAGKIAVRAIPSYYNRPENHVGEMRELLLRLAADLNDGLLANLESRVSGETFDDLLDHAEQYLHEKRKDPAGVIAGVVFEDTIRRICRKHTITEAGEKLDSLINALKAKAVLTKPEGKSAVTAAGLRTSATHAQWHEFKIEDESPTIDFTRRLIREHLES